MGLVFAIGLNKGLELVDCIGVVPKVGWLVAPGTDYIVD